MALPWFTTRDWGNLALHVDDEPELVVENRKELGLMLGFSVENWVTGNQVHQTRIAWVQAEHRGRGALGCPTLCLIPMG